jgi:hypothetical protein
MAAARSLYAIRPAGCRAGSALPQQPRRTLSHHSPAPTPRNGPRMHPQSPLRTACQTLARSCISQTPSQPSPHAPFGHRTPRANRIVQQPQSQFLLTVAALGISHRPLPVFFTQMLGRCQRNFPIPPADSQPLTALAVSYETVRTNLNSALLTAGPAG